MKQAVAEEKPKITIDDLKKSRARLAFCADGSKGSAIQVKVCVEYPRLKIVYSRENRASEFKKSFMVDDQTVPSIEAAVEALNGPCVFHTDDPEAKKVKDAAALVIPKPKRGRPPLKPKPVQMDIFRDSPSIPLLSDEIRKKEIDFICLNNSDVYHMVPRFGERAECGVKPNKKGYWMRGDMDRGREPTCPRCVDILASRY